MDDLELADLLRQADRQRSMTAEERLRVLAAVDAADRAPVAPRRARSGRWLAAAAVVLVVLGLVAVAGARRTPEQSVAVPPPATETLPAAPTVWCAERIVPLADALERWRGVENWAWAGGVPDVGSLVADALETVDADEAPGAAALAAALREELDDIAGGGPVGAGREQAERRVAAVDSALDRLLGVMVAVDPACPSGSIDEAR